jgi:phage tail sheath gpL-like
MGQYSSPAGPIFFAGALTNGVAQVETAVIVGTITLAGNATFTITSAIVTGSPLAVSVAVALNDTATLVAAKAAAVLNATPAVADHFTASSNAANLVLTAVKSAANDATLNIAYVDGTCTGLTADATSDNTTAGVLGDFRGLDNGALVIDLTAKTVKRNIGTSAVPIWTVV